VPGGRETADQRGDARRGPDIDRTTYKATTSIDILAPPSTLRAATDA